MNGWSYADVATVSRVRPRLASQALDTSSFPDTMLASNKLQGFTQKELELVLNRIDRDRGDSKADKLTWTNFRAHVASWELWVYGLM
jgi:hypothetical protein